jgi:S-adenosylmethionine hydrolase
VVVDPGVGTSRRAIALQTERGLLVGPDNGVLSAVTDSASLAVELTNLDYWRVSQPSTTFHGRDIFAPVAAHLARGVPLEHLGCRLELASLVRLPIAGAIATATGWQGTVQYIDRFGNAATTIAARAVESGQWQVSVKGSTVPFTLTYGAVAPGEGLAVVGSHGFLEVAVNRGSAQARFGLAVGDPVALEAAD